MMGRGVGVAQHPAIIFGAAEEQDKSTLDLCGEQDSQLDDGVRGQFPCSIHSDVDHPAFSAFGT